MKWKTWGSSDRSGLAGVFSEHLFYYWGQNIFPLAVFLGGGIILQLGLSQIADTCMRLRWPTTVKIESDGIWWLTHSSGPEREKKMGGEKSTSGRGKKKIEKESTRTHTCYTWGLAPVHLPSGRQHELGRRTTPEKPGIHFKCQIMT